jgi:CheY-like chemotaxis protein
MDETRTILIVEDNDFVRMQIVRYLKEAGYHTVEATDGNAALGFLNKALALAIVDVRMEPMGGLDFVKNIRGKDLETPVIFVTGDQNTDLLEQATRWGVDAVLIKPVMKDRLIKAVERSLSASGRGAV